MAVVKKLLARGRLDSESDEGFPAGFWQKVGSGSRESMLHCQPSSFLVHFFGVSRLLSSAQCHEVVCEYKDTLPQTSGAIPFRP